jgi:glycogen phosphorylase
LTPSFFIPQSFKKNNLRFLGSPARGRLLSVRDVNTSTTVEAIKQRFNEHLHFTVGKDRHTADARDYFFVLARTAQDHLMKKFIRTQQHYYNQDPKVCHKVFRQHALVLHQ